MVPTEAQAEELLATAQGHRRVGHRCGDNRRQLGEMQQHDAGA